MLTVLSFVAAILSAISAYELPEFGPGLVFGLLVLVPAGWAWNISTLRIVLSVLGSVIGYPLALYCWHFLHDAPSSLTAGATAGVLIAAGPLFRLDDAKALRGLLAVITAGTIASGLAEAIFSLPDNGCTGEVWEMRRSVGIAAWQTGVAWTLRLALRGAYDRRDAG